MAILSKLVIGVSGTLPHDPQQIKKWVEANGGRWATGSKKGTQLTHLIASKDAWKKAGDDVQQAADRGIWIVSYDWLEDSLQGKRKLSEKKYTWEYIRKGKKKQKKLKRLGAATDGTSIQVLVTHKPKKSNGFFFKPASVPDTPFQSAAEALKQKRAEREAASGVADGSAQAPIEIDDEESGATPSRVLPSATDSVPKASSVALSVKTTSSPSSSKAATAVVHKAKSPHIKDLYHYYLDTTGFEYKIVLVRSDFSTNSSARYHIGLLESHTKPYTYCTIVQYTPPAKPAPQLITAPTAPCPGLRNRLLDFLRNSEKPADQTHNTLQPLHQSRATLPAPSPPDEAARCVALITAPNPNPTTHFKTLICPMNSPYDPAYRAFRHAFRDLTLLTWEERFDADKVTQKARARTLNIEPFLYAKPSKGMPTGLTPQEVGYLVGKAGQMHVYGEAEEGYMRNEWRLPGLECALSQNGVIGAALLKDQEEQRKKEEEEKRKLEEEEERLRRERGEASKVERRGRPNYNKPMFNGVQGNPAPNDGLWML